MKPLFVPLLRLCVRSLGKEESKLKVVYSKEPAIKPLEDSESNKKINCVCPPGTERKCSSNDRYRKCFFVPSVAGLIIAGEVIKDIVGIR